MLDIFFSPEYGKLNEMIENGICEVFNYQSNSGKVRHLFLKRKIDLSLNDNVDYFDIVSPYGYGGPVILEVKDKEKLIKEYFEAFSEYALKNNIVSEFIRFHLFDNVDLRERYYGETCEISINIIRDFTSTMDEIWMEFEPKVRKNVKRALSKNLKIITDPEGRFITDFLEIFYSTMKRSSAREYYYFPKEYFEKLNTDLKGHYIYFHVMIQGKIISTELVLFSEKYAYSYLGGTIAEYYDYRPNDLLKFEIIKWCKETNKELFILGGGYSQDDGISRYKKSFAPKGFAKFYVGKKIHNQLAYQNFTDIKKNQIGFDVNTKYFPAYRG